MNPAITLTIASYNICHGRYADFEWELLAAPIRSVDPDLVGIQEVDMFTHRSHNMDTLHALREAVGLPYALFLPTMDYDGGQYGTAVLSRFPIALTSEFFLSTEDLEPRAVECIRVFPGNAGGLWFVNTHFSYRSADVRHKQLTELKEHLHRIADVDDPTVITGDFNTEEPIAPVLGARFADINGALRYRTFQDPPIAIDRILYTRESLVPLSHGMVESSASDHNLLWAKFELQ